MQHACRKQKAMLQRAKIRRLRHTPAIMRRHEPSAAGLVMATSKKAEISRRRRYLSSP
jgi:hypothetical protein